MAENFNDFFVNVGSNLAAKISSSSKTFDSYLNNFDTPMDETDLKKEELRTPYAFRSL